jgi:hypothetical protein
VFIVPPYRGYTSLTPPEKGEENMVSSYKPKGWREKVIISILLGWGKEVSEA